MNNIDIISTVLNSILDSYAMIIFCSNSRNKKRDSIYKKNYKLYKTSMHSDTFKYSILPKRDFENTLKLEEHFESKLPEEIKEIFKTFVEYIDSINLEHCLKNISTVNIQNKYTIKEKLNKLFKMNYTSGTYNASNNSIELYDRDKYTLSHEFLHMASSSKKGNIYACGFYIKKLNYLTKTVDTFGNGLDEGYTELLNMRIFNNEKINESSYIQNIKITRLIECFFDNYKDMEYAYFHNDIDAVYRAFSKYGTREEYFMIMNELDCYADSPMTSDFLSSIIVQLKLYEIIKRSNDEEKIKNFERVLNQNLNGKLNIIKNINATKMQKQLKRGFKKASAH